MKKYLLLFTMLLFPVLLFPQQQHRQDSIALIEEHHITDSGIYLDDSTKNQPNTTLAVLEFTTTAKTKYALDQYREIYAKVTEYFMKYKPTVSDMIASAKFMLPGESDEIFVRIKESKADFDPSKVHFVTNNGKEYTGTYNSQDKGWTLNIVGSSVGDGQEIYVVYEESKGKFTTLDKLNVYSYERKSINIKLVPINGFANSFNVNALSTELNRIYGKVGVTCNLSVAESGFSYTPVNGNSFDVTGSGLFSTETADMKAIKQAYSAYLGGNLDGNTLYLFIIEKVTGADGVAGDMPRGKRFGYLFPGTDARTIAHEIGHGAFNLEHPFDRPLRGEFDRGQLAHCLMDYASGTEFCKLEWDAINAPGLVIGILETDEGGMRKDEVKRSQITRFMYALKECLQNQTPFSESKVLRTDDIKLLNAKEKIFIKADHIFYDELLSDYFEEIELKVFFDAKNQLNKSPNELFFLKDINNVNYLSWHVGSLDAVIVFVFKQGKDIPKFNEFLGEKDALTPPVSSTRKVFFVHETDSDPERWMEHPLTKSVLLSIAGTDKYDDKFSWEEYNSLPQQAVFSTALLNRNKAAQKLVDYVLKNSQSFNEIVLIGHSHGGNVSLQAVNQLVKKGKTVYLITTATPAYNNAIVDVLTMGTLQNCDFVREITTSVHNGGQITHYEFKNPENPMNTQLKQHMHLWNKEDKVAGDLAGDDYYKLNGITENIEIPTEKEYNDFVIRFNYLWDEKIKEFINPEFINAHGFDANRPQLIYQMMLNGKIKPLK